MKGVAKGEFPWQVGNALGRIAVGFTTTGAGVATLKNSYNGSVTLARATNTYTFTFPSGWALTNAIHDSQLQATAVSRTLTVTPSAGTIAVVFGGAFNSGDYNLTLEFCGDPNG